MFADVPAFGQVVATWHKEVTSLRTPNESLGKGSLHPITGSGDSFLLVVLGGVPGPLRPHGAKEAVYEGRRMDGRLVARYHPQFASHGCRPRKVAAVQRTPQVAIRLWERRWDEKALRPGHPNTYNDRSSQIDKHIL